MASQKEKWKGSLQKARRLSQGSPTYSRKTSLIEEETSAKELEEYLETLKKKSGIKSLWTGRSFDKVVRDDEDKTPDISISSMEDDDERFPAESGDGDSDDDFKPKIQMFSRSATPSPDNSSESSINPMKGLQMAESAFSDGEVSNNILANNKLEDQLKSLSISDKDVRSVVNNLTVPTEVQTEDEVEEEIEEDHVEKGTATGNKQDVSGKSAPRHSIDSTVLENSTPSPRTVSERDSRSSGNNEKSQDHSKQSYTLDFSSASEAKTVSSKSRSQTHSKKSRSGRSSASSNSSRSLRSSRSSRKSKSHSRSTRKSTSDYSKSESTSSWYNRNTCDIGTQTVRPMEQFSMPPGLGVGSAWAGAPLGMQYVDPAPIATHTVSAEALEAVTAYNPSIVVLNNMLREQIRLVEQFVNINQRMYESYCSGMNNNYRYTTLEDTQEYIRRNRPKILSFEEALEQVAQEDR